MPNEQYQSLFGLLRRGSCASSSSTARRPASTGARRRRRDDELAPLVTDLGGHDLAGMLDAYAAVRRRSRDRPSVVFAYTVKGWGLPIAGNPRNHSALLSGEQIDDAAGQTRPDAAHRVGPVRRLDRRPASWCNASAREPAAPGRRAPPSTPRHVPEAHRDAPRPEPVVHPGGVRPDRWSSWPATRRVAPYLVTTAPDVATSTNLAGFINRTGVFAPGERRSWSDDPVLRWAEGPSGQHIELGISEMNLFLLLGQLGLSWDLSGAAAAAGRHGLRPVRAAAASTPSSTASTPARGSSSPARRPA